MWSHIGLIHRSYHRVLPPFALPLTRHLRRGGFAALLLAGSIASAPSLAQAQEFLSIKGNTVNILRQAHYQVRHCVELINGYPVQVIAKQDDWVKVKDFEGALGWVHLPLTSSEAYYLIKV